jgi:hypothetical protein
LPYKSALRLVLATAHFAFGSSTVVSADFRAWIHRNLVFEQIGGFGGTSGANLTRVTDSGKCHKGYGGVEFFLVHMKRDGLARDLLAFHKYLHLHEMKWAARLGSRSAQTLQQAGPEKTGSGAWRGVF